MIAIATQSSVGVYDDVLFSAHMVQHVLLIMVAPPLLVLGRPVTLVLHSWGNPVHRTVKRLIRSRPVSALTQPAVATTLYCAVVVRTHTPPFMDLVLRDEAVHDAEHALYLAAGYLFFLSVLGIEPVRNRASTIGREWPLLRSRSCTLLRAGTLPRHPALHRPDFLAGPMPGAERGSPDRSSKTSDAMDTSSLTVIVMPILTLIALFTGIARPFIAGSRSGRGLAWGPLVRAGARKRIGAGGRKARPQKPGADDAAPSKRLGSMSRHAA